MTIPTHRPQRSGPWRILFSPKQYSSYVNDHTIIRCHDGRWRLYGCAQLSTTVNPEMERYLVHGSTPSLAEPMTEHRPVVDNGTRAWAPGAVRVGDRYFMYYGPSPTMMAHSIDGQHWMGNAVSMIGTPVDAAHRDHMVVRLDDDAWLMYAVGIREGRGCVSVHVSNDLIQWRFVRYALTSDPAAPLKPAWGAIESPFVVRYGAMWYLFVTYTDCSRETYHQTLVYRSPDPFDFGTLRGTADDERVIARLDAHAAEVLLDEQGQWHVTTAGWHGFGAPHEGCVSIAPLDWIET